MYFQYNVFLWGFINIRRHNILEPFDPLKIRYLSSGWRDPRKINKEFEEIIFNFIVTQSCVFLPEWLYFYLSANPSLWLNTNLVWSGFNLSISFLFISLFNHEVSTWPFEILAMLGWTMRKYLSTCNLHYGAIKY